MNGDGAKVGAPSLKLWNIAQQSLQQLQIWP
jgi:hypothetical protein